jgi:hypothetical protein
MFWTTHFVISFLKFKKPPSGGGFFNVLGNYLGKRTEQTATESAGKPILVVL